MDLWSGHDVALGTSAATSATSWSPWSSRPASSCDDTMGWNVLLRPVARTRRRTNTSESEMAEINPLLNLALRAVVRVESWLPVKRRRGISLVLRATRPA